MKKITLALLALVLTAGLLWAYEGTQILEYDTTEVTGFLKVLGGYDLAGSGGAGWADSLRDSTETTHAADSYPRKLEKATIGSTWTFQENIIVGGEGSYTPTVEFVPNVSLTWLNNWNKFLFTRSLEVQGTIECESLNATNSNILGMTIYSGDSTYNTNFWLMPGANMSFTYTDTGIQIAASSTTGAATADSLLDGTTYHSGDEFLRLARDGTITGTQTFTTDPVFMGDAIKDSMVEDGITIDTAEYAKKSDALGTYGATDYPRKAEGATIDSSWIFLSVMTCSNNFVLTGSLGTGGDTISVASYLNVAGGHNLTLDTAQWAAVADSAETTAFAWTLPNSSVLWDWLSSAVQDSATKGVLAIKSADSTYTGNVYMLGGTGITIDQNDTGITITASGTTTVSIAESLDVGGTPYEGDDFTRRNANESIANLWTFVGGIDVDGNILADGGVFLRTDAQDFEVDCDDITLGDDKTTDTVEVKGVYNGWNDMVIAYNDPVAYSPPGASWAKTSFADLVVEGGGNFGRDVYIDGALEVDGAFPYQTINANNGLTGTATAKVINLDVVGSHGIDVSANAVAVDVTDLLGTGVEEEVGGLLATTYGIGAGTACEGNDSRLPTSDEKSALGGEGTPSGANKFTTKSYTEATYANISGGEDIDNLWTFNDGLIIGDGVGIDSLVHKGDFARFEEQLISGPEGSPNYAGSGAGKETGTYFLCNQDMECAGPAYFTWAALCARFYGFTDFKGDVTLGDASSDSICVKGKLVAEGDVSIYTGSGGVTITGKNITADLGTSVNSAEIEEGTIQNSNIFATANIARSKIASSPAWTNADVAENLTLNSSATVDPAAITGLVLPIWSDATSDTASAPDSLPIYRVTGRGYVDRIRTACYVVGEMDRIYVRILARCQMNNPTFSANVRIKVDATTGTASSAISTTSWTGYYSSIDVSGLSGTVHQITVQLQGAEDEAIDKWVQMKEVCIYATY